MINSGKPFGKWLYCLVPRWSLKSRVKLKGPGRYTSHLDDSQSGQRARETRTCTNAQGASFYTILSGRHLCILSEHIRLWFVCWLNPFRGFTVVWWTIPGVLWAKWKKKHYFSFSSLLTWIWLKASIAFVQETTALWSSQSTVHFHLIFSICSAEQQQSAFICNHKLKKCNIILDEWHWT